MHRRIHYYSTPFRNTRFCSFLICWLFALVYYLNPLAYFVAPLPSPITSRLHPDLPLTFDLRSYAVCHPEEFHLNKISSIYHQSFKQEACFLIENLDGGPWWSYVSHEFAEILTALKQIGIRSNVKYRTFTQPTDFNSETNLSKYLLNACDLDEQSYKQNPVPIVILIWDVNLVLWHEVSEYWKSVFENFKVRLVAFIDDLHYTDKSYYRSRQYLFESFASEIFSTYAYLFHNYYSNISQNRITWLPHAASRLSYHSINHTAANILFVSGANIYEWYPCRARAFALCLHKLKHLVKCLRHPGYGAKMKHGSAYHYGGQRYFSYMQQYVFGFGTCQSVNYAIAKLFELPANGLALVTTNDLVPILERLHLYHNEHFLTVDCTSLHVLKNEIERLQNLSNVNVEKIRKQGQNVIFERHMTEHRAQLLHVRLLAQALMLISSTDQERLRWKRWGRDCR
ncbi:unnamed protein product [Adineta ricciae]|uniref:Uncharacterized protein n=1 Tax=Adineta ricciae TaxID=249248 RepID=A0A816CWA9_ADIRI|nr:unnamed protein product [Adineta ricciae]CAF1626964.1 unnamed protein product [Adineta ricciae]